MIRKRKVSDPVKEMFDEVRKNPIVSEQVLPHESVTNIEHIKELQRILVQTCIDYINKNGLTDIYSVSFYADALAESAHWGEWEPCTDSSIHVKGLDRVINTRKDGSTFESGQTYDIGGWM